MKFWKLNKKKVFLIWTLFFIASFSFLFFVTKKIEPSIIYSLILSIFFTCMDVLGGLIFFGAIGSIIKNESEISIVPLFDNGYIIELQNEGKRIKYTTEFLKGTISDIPAIVTFYHDPRSPFSTLFFTFSLSQNGKNIEQSISFDMGFNRRLKKDIKPEVLKFISDIKEKEYQ